MINLLNQRVLRNYSNTFTQDDRVNVCMQIGDTPGANGTCQLTTIDDGSEIFFNNTITINEDLLGITHSNFEVAKTIIHEFIHAYLNVLSTDCTNFCNTCILNEIDLPTVIDEFYQQGCSIGAPNNSMHAFMFDYMIPAFEAVFTDVGHLLTSQSSIDYVSQLTWDDGTYQENFSWENFYHYFAMAGLHTNSAFIEEIENNPYQNFLFENYIDAGQSMSKECN